MRRHGSWRNSRNGGEYHMIRHTQQTIDTQAKISPLVPNEPGNLGSFLPEFLVELSTRTMRSLTAGAFTPTETTAHNDNPSIVEPHDQAIVVTPGGRQLQTIPLEPSSSSSPVVGIDVSSIKIGETERGIIGALRGAIVWRINNRYSFLRCGPLIFHIGGPASAELLGYLGLTRFDGADIAYGVTERLLIRLRNMLERWLQENVASTFRKAVILIDGSLTTGTPDNPARNLIRVLKAAKDRDNRVLAFSKSTHLALQGKLATALVATAPAPCLLDIDECVREQFPSHPILLLGRVYVAKLSRSGYAFRLDIDRDLSEQYAVDAAQSLIASDLVEQGYPETLRLAHIYSTFTAPEVIAMQRHITSTYGAQMLSRFSLRRSLFGPFGTGREFFH